MTDVIEAIRSGVRVEYFHAFQWKVGFYDPVTKVFVATVELGSTLGRQITTVIANAEWRYVWNKFADRPWWLW